MIEIRYNVVLQTGESKENVEVVLTDEDLQKAVFNQLNDSRYFDRVVSSRRVATEIRENTVHKLLSKN
jgi:hypothetical protein